MPGFPTVISSQVFDTAVSNREATISRVSAFASIAAAITSYEKVSGTLVCEPPLAFDVVSLQAKALYGSRSK